MIIITQNTRKFGYSFTATSLCPMLVRRIPDKLHEFIRTSLSFQIRNGEIFRGLYSQRKRLCNYKTIVGLYAVGRHWSFYRYNSVSIIPKHYNQWINDSLSEENAYISFRKFIGVEMSLYGVFRTRAMVFKYPRTWCWCWWID